MEAQSIIDRVRPILYDEQAVRWPDPELLAYIGDAQQQIIQIAPAANSVTQAVALEAGSTRQSAPENSLRVLNVLRNLGAAGNQPGRGIVMTSLAALNAMDSRWHMEQDIEVHQWAYDPDSDRDTFWVYPAPFEAMQVEMIFSKRPSPVLTVQASLDLTENYINPVVDWVLYRCFSKDADYGGNAGRAQQHVQAFSVAMGIKTQTFQATDPNLKRRGGETNGQV